MKLFKKLKICASYMMPSDGMLSNEKGLVATSTAIIAGAAVAGAAGVASTAISSAGAKRASQTAADAQYAALSAQEKAAIDAKNQRDEAVRLKQEAAKNIKFPTLLETPEAQEYKKTLQDRMAGRGLIDVNKETAPVANQVRAGLEQTQAGLSSLSSAKGLGRSTVATAQGVQASQAAERDIASRLSNLELVRQEQMGQAVSQFGSLAESEAASQQNKARFQQGAEFNIADTIANDANATRNDQFAIANTIAQNGANAASWQLLNSQIIAAGLIGAGETFNSGMSDMATNQLLEKMVAEQSSRSAASVNIGSNLGTTRILGEQIGGNLGGF